MKVLIFDDNPDHRELLSLAMQSAPIPVDITLVANADAFFETLEQHVFDCVVIDYSIPPHTAVELLDAASASLGDTPVLVVSSSDDQRVVIESMRTGVSDFLPKDEATEPEALWRRVKTAVVSAKRRRAERRRSNRRLEALRMQADTDPLTGLFNRRYANRVLEASRLKRDRRTPVACALFDVDHFKSINDTFGHAAGDRVLQCVARTLKDATLDSDILVRWGGEEFLLLRTSEGLADMWIAAERIRQSIARLPIDIGRPLNITVSAGVSSLPSLVEGSRLVDQADRALYLAKDSGRDCVRTWEMLQALELASEVSLDTSEMPRWARFIMRVRPYLGARQIEHVETHGRVVQTLATSLARAIGFSHGSVERIGQAALLHDIGKVAVPEELLATARRLSTDEKRLVDEHARLGADIAATLGMPEPIPSLIGAHHVRFDDGYTDGVHRMASVISVADAIAAMMMDRPYSKACPLDEALIEIKRHRGGQFDPIVVDAIDAISKQASAGSELKEDAAC